jgi:hypothetical protein
MTPLSCSVWFTGTSLTVRSCRKNHRLNVTFALTWPQLADGLQVQQSDLIIRGVNRMS